MVHGSLLFISWDWGTSLQCFGGGNPLQPGGETHWAVFSSASIGCLCLQLQGGVHVGCKPSSRVCEPHLM